MPAVAVAADARAIGAWSSPQDGGGDGVYGQRFDSGGAPTGLEFRVNSCTTGDQESPVVAAAADGRFLVVWDSLDQDGGSQGLYGQHFDSTRGPAGAEFRVNGFTTDDQQGAALASTPDGRYVVVWTSVGQDGSGNGVFGRRYATELVFRDGFEGAAS